MTIYEIREATKETAPFFFARSTLRFFHQTMKSFHVTKEAEDIWRIQAPMRDCSRNLMGFTIRYFWKDQLFSTLAEAQEAQKGD